MSKEEIAEKLHEFGEYLHLTGIVPDMIRYMIWICSVGIAAIVDELENIVDDVLLVKKFFQNSEVSLFIDTIRPLLFILLAFSLLWTGYMLIFQKKFQREGLVMNIFISIIIVGLLSTGMNKANEFTDKAVNVVKVDSIYGNTNGELGTAILKDNIIDVSLFDQSGWISTELANKNTIPVSRIKGIDIREKLDKDGLSPAGEDISENKYKWDAARNKDSVQKLDQGGVEWNNEYYYRYHVDWLSLLVTLSVVGFTLLSIAVKVSRLSFELTFNYILATFVAPADVHDGQKTKIILQQILNTFLVTMLIFVSLKLYMIGINFITENTEGLVYLIALIAFSMAVIDGPNMVERLFGIDAGLKNGWGVLAGAYAGSKAIAGLGKGLAKLGKTALGSRNDNEKIPSSNGSKLGITKAKSPNTEGGNEDKDKKATKEAMANHHAKDSSSKIESQGISSQSDQNEQGKKQATKAPSPNDDGKISATSGSQILQTARAQQFFSPITQTDSEGTIDSEQLLGSTTEREMSGGNGGGIPNGIAVNPSSSAENMAATSGSQILKTARAQQSSVSQIDSDVTNVAEHQQGTTGVVEMSSGNEVAAPNVNTVGLSSQAVNSPATTGSQMHQTARAQQSSISQIDSDVTNVVEHQQGAATVVEMVSRSEKPAPNANTVSPSPQVVSSLATSGSQMRQTVSAQQSSVVQVDKEILSIANQQQGAVTVCETNIGGFAATATNVRSTILPSNVQRVENGTQTQQTINEEQRSSVQTNIEVAATIEQTTDMKVLHQNRAIFQTTTESTQESSHSKVVGSYTKKRPNAYEISSKKEFTKGVYK